ncbi:MAG: carboxypeptidase-like regulatory domain-containing protein [Balneolaceae bacterium]
MTVKWVHSVLVFLIYFASGHVENNSWKTIEGFVFESGSHYALEDVNVYLSGTSEGTTTGADGSFSFQTRLSGNFTLVFSYVGYKTKSIAITLNEQLRTYTYHVQLKRDRIELNSIKVVTSNDKWLRNLNEFEEQLVGRSDNARHTYIENPWVLEFERDQSNRLFAKTTSPLSIVNRALGYKINLDLVEFEWAEIDFRFMYLGRLRFEPISVFDASVQERWEKRRKNTYTGSFEHFLQSLYHSRLRSDGFTVFRLGSKFGLKIQELEEGELRYELMIRGISYFSVPEIRGFRLNKPARVEFRGKSNRPDYETRLMEPVDENGIFFVFPNGHLLNPRNMRLGGLWGEQRLADRVPLDYSP